MIDRFRADQLEAWRRDGVALIEAFFTPAEVAAVQADFARAFGRAQGGEAALTLRKAGEVGKFNPAQFTSFEAIPFHCSPALNLIGVHPALLRFARAALGTERIHLYQCQAWAKFTGAADYEQPFHCDFVNHTLVAPSEDARLNSLTVLCYFTDVTEADGPMHYVTRTDSAKVAGPEASLATDPKAQAALQAALKPYERSSASVAGSIVPYGIDVYHRGTNLVGPGARRYAVMACFKAADNDTIGYHAWPFHHRQPWAMVFDHATPDQLSAFGVPRPGEPFWTPVTLARAQARYPGWDLAPYRAGLG